jgi:hypothetical protein
MIPYCLGIWLMVDFSYAGLTRGEKPRIANPVFHHTFATNFAGYDEWGDRRHKLFTNNLGFKDAIVRDVPMMPATRRIMLIGDSFTEAVGMAFADSFAGMLHTAGQARAAKIEFLNTGVSGYSPTLYYKKVKYFVELGLRFDELVVLPDMSDVATKRRGISASMMTPFIRPIAKRTALIQCSARPKATRWQSVSPSPT